MGTSALEVVDYVGGQYDGCVAFEKAPHFPVAGTSSVPAFYEKVQAALFFPDNLTALRALDLFSGYSASLSVSPKNPLDVWGACASSRITVFGKPGRLRVGSGGEWGDEVLADLCSERNIRLQLQGKVGAPQWFRPKNS